MFKLPTLRDLTTRKMHSEERKFIPQGHTLTEVMLALAVVGIASVFVVPKMLYTNSVNQDRAKLREAIGILAQIQQEGMELGEFPPPPLDATKREMILQFLAKKLNYLSLSCKFTPAVCAINDGNEGNKYFFTLPNGVDLHFEGINNEEIYWFYIYANGYDPFKPAIYGQNALIVVMCTSSKDCWSPSAGRTFPAGGMSGYSNWSDDLYEKVFRNN